MKIPEMALAHIIMNLARYFFFASVAYWIFYGIYRKDWSQKKIQQKYPHRRQLNYEIKNGLVSIIIFALIGILFAVLNRMGCTRLYLSIADRGWGYFIFTIGVLLFWHDTYFYWTHRALHHPKLMRFHATHHRSYNTTPFTAFSFHPVESLLQSGFLIVVFILPINLWALAFALTWQMVFNVTGHLGFEIFPLWWHRSCLGKYFNTVTHHNMHHQFHRENYGLYFSFWDDWMKTNHQDYPEEYLKNAYKMSQKTDSRAES
jgi:Delta7-sterol 5-desaturase